MSALAPLPIEPREVDVIWGGDTLVRRFGKPGDPDVPIGESWECWDDNRVADGLYAGRSIGDLRTLLEGDLMGSLAGAPIFPILTKFIDARQSLSVQVHPDDAYAQRVEHQANGKTECWYILDAAPGAELILGWSREMSRDEYVRRVADGTLAEVLRRVPVRPRDAFYLPAGTLHAIGAGIVLFETQQASDLTYRIFDWNRVGADGKPRQLHVEKAADVLDYRASHAGALRSLTYDLKGVRRTTLVADRRFVLERVELGATFGSIALEGLPLAVTALDRPVELETAAGFLRLQPYATALLGAGSDDCEMRAPDGDAAALTAAPVHDADAISQRYARASVNPAESGEFLAQFRHASGKGA
jgi:mannose-6-phosphate isomerase